MKSKFLLLASFIFAGFNFSFSQTQFGVQVSGVSATTDFKVDGTTSAGKKSLMGYKIGAVAKIGLNENFSFMPELNLLSSGGKFSNTETYKIGSATITTTNESKLKPSFIQIPLNIAYTKALSNDNSFFVGLGPVVSFGIGGKISSDYTQTTTVSGSTTTSNSSESTKFKFDGKKNADATDDDFHLKALDFGGNFFAGYKLANGFFVKASYKIGFSNLLADDNSSYKTNYLGLGIGYLFGAHK